MACPGLKRALSAGNRSDGAGRGAAGGVTVRLADRLVPAIVAVIDAVVVAGSALVLTVKLALVAPAGTVTLSSGEAAAGLLLDRFTRIPPAGAVKFKVTVPCT